MAALSPTSSPLFALCLGLLLACGHGHWRYLKRLRDQRIFPPLRAWHCRGIQIGQKIFFRPLCFLGHVIRRPPFETLSEQHVPPVPRPYYVLIVLINICARRLCLRALGLPAGHAATAKIGDLNIGLPGATRAGTPGIEPRCLDKRLTAVKHVDNLWKQTFHGGKCAAGAKSGSGPRVE